MLVFKEAVEKQTQQFVCNLKCKWEIEKASEIPYSNMLRNPTVLCWEEAEFRKCQPRLLREIYSGNGRTAIMKVTALAWYLHGSIKAIG